MGRGGGRNEGHIRAGTKDARHRFRDAGRDDMPRDAVKDVLRDATTRDVRPRDEAKRNVRHTTRDTKPGFRHATRSICPRDSGIQPGIPGCRWGG